MCAEQGKHPFPHKRIPVIVKEYKWDRWDVLSEKLAEIAKQSKKEYSKIKPLINYLD